MDHAFYIGMAYGFTGIVILALIGWVYFDAKARRRDLEALESVASERQPRPARDEAS